MIEVRSSGERHHEQYGWLDTKWSFSFDSYYDPAQVSFGPLRVFNEDLIQPGSGFPTHPHRDMEILTFVLAGAIQHQDSLGNCTTIRAEEVQRMTAGTGIRHSEANPSSTDPTHLLQVWILPDRLGRTPSYEQKSFSAADRHNRLLPVVSAKPNGAAIGINQDVTVYRSRLDPGVHVVHRFDSDRRGYVFLINGTARANGTSLEAGDAAKVTGEPELEIYADRETELLLLDMP